MCHLLQIRFCKVVLSTVRLPVLYCKCMFLFGLLNVPVKCVWFGCSVKLCRLITIWIHRFIMFVCIKVIVQKILNFFQFLKGCIFFFLMSPFLNSLFYHSFKFSCVVSSVHYHHTRIFITS